MPPQQLPRRTSRGSRSPRARQRVRRPARHDLPLVCRPDASTGSSRSWATPVAGAAQNIILKPPQCVRPGPDHRGSSQRIRVVRADADVQGYHEQGSARSPCASRPAGAARSPAGRDRSLERLRVGGADLLTSVAVIDTGAHESRAPPAILSRQRCSGLTRARQLVRPGRPLCASLSGLCLAFALRVYAARIAQTSTVLPAASRKVKMPVAGSTSITTRPK
jgi:hypothetical protein